MIRVERDLKCVYNGSRPLPEAEGPGFERDSLQSLSPLAMAMEGASKGEEE